MISILYLEDVHNIVKRGGFEVLKLKDLNKNFIITIIYLQLQWIAAFNLLAPGFITSNAVYLIFVIILIIINKIGYVR